MGLSELRGKYPATPEVQTVLANKKNLRADLQRSPLIIVLADAFAQEGSLGLRELMRRIDSSGLAIKPEEDFFKQIPQEYITPVREHYAAIFFGIAVISLHETLSDKDFNANVFCERHNLATDGTLYPKLTYRGENPVIRLSDEEWFAMLRQVQKDKSFAGFFEEENLHLLPSLLRRVLEETETLPLIQSIILPLYKERAQFLLSPQV